MSASSVAVDVVVAVDPCSPTYLDPISDVDVGIEDVMDAPEDEAGDVDGDTLTTALEEVSLADRDHEPPPEDVYTSKQLALSAVQAWARDHGVAYNIKRATGPGQCRLLMMCHRGGKRPTSRKPTGKRPGAATQLTNCQMKLWVVAVDKRDTDGAWRVQHCRGRGSFTHNHPPAPSATTIARHRRDSRRGVEFRAKVATLLPLSRGAKRAKLLAQDAHPDALITRQDIRNEFRAYRRDERMTKTVMEVLVKQLEQKGYVYRYDPATDEHLTSLLVIHPGCLTLYCDSPELLLADCTFKTNKYNLPMLNIISSNGNNRTIYLGFALMRDVDESAFTWVFGHLKELFSTHNLPTPLFITDRDEACINAIETVFDDPIIHLCKWPMNKDVLAYIRRACGAQYKQVRNGRSFTDTDATTELMKLYFSCLSATDLPTYESRLKAIEAECHQLAAYLEREWLGRHAKKLVKMWVDQALHYGHDVTSKNEGAHRSMKDWVGGSGSDILGLFTALDIFYDEHVEETRTRDAQDNSKLRNDCAQPIFSAVFLRITRYALAKTAQQLSLARDELSKQRLDIQRRTPACKSCYTASWGLPCWHKLITLELENKVLRDIDFDIHWWTDRSKAPASTPQRKVPLEPRKIVTRIVKKTSHQKGKGKLSNRRDPSLYERFDESIPSATAPATIPYRMRSSSPNPVKGCMVLAPKQTTITGPSFPPPSAQSTRNIALQLQYPTPSSSPYNNNLQAYYTANQQQQVYPQQQYAPQQAYQLHHDGYHRHQFQYSQQPHIQQHTRPILPPLTQPMMARPIDNTSPNLVRLCPDNGAYQAEPRAYIPARQSSWVAHTTLWDGSIQ